MQLGAENFLTKPVDMEHLAAATARVADKARLRRDQRDASSSRAPPTTVSIRWAHSPGMQDFAHQVGLLAQSERTTVLLTGESGTGKGWVARMIHDLSPRARAPFVEVNCAGLNATFLDSELFGHEKGAFTDAKDRKQGLFEIADHGTIFLDEIGDLAPELQPKLLKVLETKTFRRLGRHPRDHGGRAPHRRHQQGSAGRGGDRSVPGGPVLPAQRHAAHAAGAARPLPRGPPRAHHPPHDGPPRRAARRSHRRSSSEVLERLLAYGWPGNVREMRNVLERALILGRGPARASASSTSRASSAPGPASATGATRPLSLEDLERQHIERTLKHHTGNRTRAAIELGISPRDADQQDQAVQHLGS